MPATIQQQGTWKVRRRQQGNRGNKGIVIWILHNFSDGCLKFTIVVGRNVILSLTREYKSGNRGIFFQSFLKEEIYSLQY